MSTFERVVEVLSKMEFNVEKVRLSTNFARDMNMDSLDQIEVVMAMEEEFGQTIPEDARDALVSVTAVVGYVDAHS